MKDEWDAMTPEERNEATRDPIAKLKDARETRKEGVHNVSIAQFHDVRGTISKVEDLVSCYLTLLCAYSPPTQSSVPCATALAWRSCWSPFAVTAATSPVPTRRPPLRPWRTSFSGATRRAPRTSPVDLSPISCRVSKVRPLCHLPDAVLTYHPQVPSTTRTNACFNSRRCAVASSRRSFVSRSHTCH